MNEQKIIINNVDVSECEFFEECEVKIDDSECLAYSRHYYEGTLYDCCDEHPDCYYKQLKRKEQECEELKAKIKYIEEYIKTVENARNEFEKESNFLKEENKRLKQTLAKIKEIAKNMNKECFYDDFYCKNCDMKNGCTYQGKLKILQKINEVELNGTNP